MGGLILDSSVAIKAERAKIGVVALLEGIQRLTPHEDVG